MLSSSYYSCNSLIAGSIKISSFGLIPKPSVVKTFLKGEENFKTMNFFYLNYSILFLILDFFDKY